MFEIYLKLGFEHILDIKAYDHMLFLIALFCIFSWKDFKQALILVTAFTLGHSITLILAALDILIFPKDIIEFLIPLTILITCIHNIIEANRNDVITSNKRNTQYFMAGFLV
ncbi:MAG: HupE/UreJ family protein [Bacteroidota bacterium]